jgi:hypothetical protein
MEADEANAPISKCVQCVCRDTLPWLIFLVRPLFDAALSCFANLRRRTLAPLHQLDLPPHVPIAAALHVAVVTHEIVTRRFAGQRISIPTRQVIAVFRPASAHATLLHLAIHLSIGCRTSLQFRHSFPIKSPGVLPAASGGGQTPQPSFTTEQDTLNARASCAPPQSPSTASLRALNNIGTCICHINFGATAGDANAASPEPLGSSRGNSPSHDSGSMRDTRNTQKPGIPPMLSCAGAGSW